MFPERMEAAPLDLTAEQCPVLSQLSSCGDCAWGQRVLRNRIISLKTASAEEQATEDVVYCLFTESSSSVRFWR